MTPLGWAQIVLLLALLLATAGPLGAFMARLAAGHRTMLHPVLAPVERGFLRLASIDRSRRVR
jgi:K+-transporting ATPase ATPase A chain